MCDSFIHFPTPGPRYRDKDLCPQYPPVGFPPRWCVRTLGRLYINLMDSQGPLLGVHNLTADLKTFPFVL
jgi:hypothetical protein